jgi:hypothetical protein
MKRESIVTWGAAIVVSLSTSLAQAQITDSLVVHLPFDDAYTNSRNNGIEGTPIGTPTFGPGKIGSAVALTTLRDGSVINYVTLGYPTELQFGALRDGNASDFSIAFWCNYTNQIDDPAFIANQNWNSSNNRGWGIYTQGSGNWRVVTTDDQGSAGKQSTTLANPAGLLRDGTWHHVVVTWSRNASPPTVSFYKDGAVLSSASLAVVTGPIDTLDLGNAVNIGEDGTGSYTDGGSAEMINVIMDDLGIWRRVLSPGEVTAIYTAGLGGTNLAKVPAIVNPYVKSTSPGSGDAGIPANFSPIIAVITDGLNAVAPTSISLRVNGAPAAVTSNKVGTDTTVQATPPGLLPAGVNTATLIFANNASPQVFFTNTWTFSVAPYLTLGPDLKVTPDTSKPGFRFNVFANQANTATSNARAEAALAGQLIDGSGVPLANFANPAVQGIALAAAAAPNPANAAIGFEIATVINLNAIGGNSVGNFPNDDQMPGMPATDMSNDGAAAEIITYLELPAGLIAMGINSDDGFRTCVGTPPQDRIGALTVGQFDGGRAAADTIFFLNVQEAGVYGFQTLWENGTGDSDIEWFTLKGDGTKVLVNDTANGGVKAYRATTSPVNPFVRYVSPQPAPRQANQSSSSLIIVLSDGTTAIDDASIQCKVDGTTPTVTRQRQGSLVTLNYAPTGIQFPEDQHQVALTFRNVPGTFTANSGWSFCSLKNIVLPAPVIFEDFDSYAEGTVPTGWTQVNYTDCSGDYCATPGLNLDDLESDTYKPWVVVDSTRLAGLKSRIFNGPAPNQFSNGVPVTVLSSGNLIYAESDVRDGNQVQFLYTKPYNLSTVANAAVAFSSLYEQNQDNVGAVEYSIDGGQTWLPVVYYLDYVDGGGDIINNTDGTVDAVATFTAPNTDTAAWTVNGVPKGGNYGDGIAAPITQALGRFIAPRVNDDNVEGKRLEIYRIPVASRQSDVRLRFAQLGTASWYFGVDNLGFYDVSAPVRPQMSSAQVSPTALTLSWIGAGTLLEATSVTGPWTVSAHQGNPQTVSIGAGQKFFRIGPP